MMRWTILCRHIYRISEPVNDVDESVADCASRSDSSPLVPLGLVMMAWIGNVLSSSWLSGTGASVVLSKSTVREDGLVSSSSVADAVGGAMLTLARGCERVVKGWKSEIARAIRQ